MSRGAWLSLLALAGCAGSPVKVDPRLISKVEVGLVDGGTTFCAGGPPPQLRVVASGPGSRPFVTWRDGEDRAGKLDFAALDLEASAGRITADGHYVVPDDARTLLGAPLVVRASYRGRPEARASTTLTPTFS